MTSIGKIVRDTIAALDARRWMDRLQEAIVRPYRSELNKIGKLQAKIILIKRQTDALRRRLATSVDRSRSLKRTLTSGLRSLGERTSLVEGQTAALRRDLASSANHSQTLERTLTSGLGSLGERIDLAEGQTDDLRRALAASLDHSRALERILTSGLSSLREQISLVEGQNDALRRQLTAAIDQAQMLELLITGGPGARPPGATHRVAQLGNPAVSVIIPTFNRPHFVVDAISSVQRQSFTSWELIVVDDGGGEENRKAIAPFLTDGRIRYLSQEKAGSAAARNRGIGSTTAPLIAYLDDDNVWYPDFLACGVDVLATSPDVDLVYGALVSAHHGLDGTRVLLRDFDRRILLQGNFIDTSVIIHRRSLVSRFGAWASNDELKTLRDWDLVLRYTQEKPARAIKALAAYYRDCDGQRLSTLVPQDEAYALIKSKWA